MSNLGYRNNGCLIMKKKTYKTNGLIYSMLMAWTFSLWLNQGTWDLAFWKIPSVERVFLMEPGSSWARTLGTRFLGNVLSGDRLPNGARTLGTRLFVSQDTWDQVLRNVLSGDRLPNWARTLGTRFLGTYSLAIDFLIEPGHLGPGS